MEKALQEYPAESSVDVADLPGRGGAGPLTHRSQDPRPERTSGKGKGTELVDLKQLIAQADALGPLPPTTVRLAEMADNLDSNLDEIADLIEFDQALTIQLLRAANSAFSARSSASSGPLPPITTVSSRPSEVAPSRSWGAAATRCAIPFCAENRAASPTTSGVPPVGRPNAPRAASRSGRSSQGVGSTPL